MITGLDHIIIGTNTLEQTTQHFQELLGLLASGGGDHPTGGTKNRILVIGDTYLELIGIRAPQEAQSSMLTRLAQGDGYLNCVFASDNILEDSRQIAARGIQLVGPDPGELRSEQGRTRGWTRTNIERPDLTQHYPFLIQHDSQGAERRMRLAGWTTPPVHPLGVIRVISTTLAVNNLEEASTRFQRIYGFTTIDRTQENFWGADISSFPLGSGEQRFELAEPETQSVDAASSIAGFQTLSDQLQRFGESLYRMTLGVENLNNTRQFLDKHGIQYQTTTTGTQALWLAPQQTCNALTVLQQI